MTSYCLHLQGQSDKGVQSVEYFSYTFFPEDEDNYMSVSIYPATRRYISEDFNLYHHCYEVVKSRIKISSKLTIL